MRSHRVVGVLAAGLLLPMLAATPAVARPHASAKPRITFGIEPATSHHAAARPDFSYGVTPGATSADRAAVLNYSARPLSLQIYATDAVNTSTGGFGLLSATARPTGAGAWITVPPAYSTVTVPAQTGRHPGVVIVPFTLAVPVNATPGDHAAGLVASLRTVGHNASGDTVVLDQRIGTRVFVRVSGQLTPGIAVTGLHATYRGTGNPVGKGTVTVHYTVRNTGNVQYSVGQQVGVKGLLGASRHLSIAAIPLLLPGDSVQESVRVPGVWPQLRDKATVTVTPQATEGGPAPGLAPVRSSVTVAAVPWSTLALLLLLVLLVLQVVVVLRRRRLRPAAPALKDKETVNA